MSPYGRYVKTARATAITCGGPQRCKSTNPSGGHLQHSVHVRSGDGASDSRNVDYEYTYRGSDGRMKATFEQAFKGRVAGNIGGGVPQQQEAPWHLGYQMSERSLVWNDPLKARLLTRVAAAELHLSDEQLAEQLQRLQALLPELAAKLTGMRPSTIAQLIAELDSIPQRLVALKAVFPEANASKLAVRVPELVLGFYSQDHLQRLADQLRSLLPDLCVDRLVEENPGILDIEELMVAMAEAERIMPGLDIQKAMGSDPQIILSFQRGSQLIAYDPPRPIGKEDDDDEYAAYYR